MALDSQIVDVKFVQGMDTKTNKKLVVPGKWNLLRNCTLADDGSILKRPGVTGLVPGSTGDGNGLATFGTELLTVDADVVSSVSSPTSFPSKREPAAYPAGGQLGFVDVVGKSQVLRNTGMQDSCDCAYGLGLTCYAWRDLTSAGTATGVSVAVVDEATGAHLLAPFQIHTNAGTLCPRVVFSVDTFFVFYVAPTGATNSLFCAPIVVDATGGIGVNGEVALIASASLNIQNFDACEFMQSAGVGSVGVSYVWNDGVTSVRAIRVTQTLGIPAIASGPVNLISAADLPTANVQGIGVCWMSDPASGYYATFTVGSGATAMSGTAVRILNSAFATFAAALQIDATVSGAGGQRHVTAIGESGFVVAMCFTDEQSDIAANALHPLRRTEITTNGAVVSVTTAAATFANSAGFLTSATTASGPTGPWIYGKPFARAEWDSTGSGKLENGTLFLPVCVLENYNPLTLGTNTETLSTQCSMFILDGITGDVVGKALYGRFGVANAAFTAPTVTTPCSTPAVPSGWALEVTERTTLNFTAGINTTPTGVSRLTFKPRTTTPPICAQLGESTFFAGGSMSLYDSSGITEVGFPLFPEGASVVATGAGGAMTAGVHQIVFVYEWIDGMGNRVQSAPSLPISVTTVLNDSLTCEVPSMLLSQKSNIRVAPYMTQAAGLTFNRVTANGQANLLTSNVTTITITASDADIAGNELLYTQPLQAGTTLPNVAPGPCTTLGIHQNRVFVDLADQPGAFRYSQQLLDGVSLQWSETLGGTTPVDGGAIVGFCAMDEKMIIFCERKIFVIVGNGPTPSGRFNQYSDPVEVLSDVGCNEARSILKMPQGIMFKSDKGWCRLGRDLQVQYVGAGVAEFDDNDVSSAVYLEDERECRFSSLSGTQLIYAYKSEQWSTAQILAGESTYAIACAVWWPTLGLYISISPTNGLNRDTPGAYIDDPGGQAPRPFSIVGRTSFLHLGALEGFQRVRWLYLTATSTAEPIGSLTVVVDFDDVYQALATGAPGSYSTSFTLTSAFPVGTTVPDVRHKLHRQKCKSVAFTFTETGSPSAASGITGFQALALEVGMKRGTNKLPGAQSVP